MEKLKLPTSFHPNRAWIIQYRPMCERSIMWYCSHGLFPSSFGVGMTSF